MIAIVVQVLPVPVAITRRARRLFLANASATRRMASCWYGRSTILVSIEVGIGTIRQEAERGKDLTFPDLGKEMILVPVSGTWHNAGVPDERTRDEPDSVLTLLQCSGHLTPDEGSELIDPVLAILAPQPGATSAPIIRSSAEAVNDNETPRGT